MIPDVVEARHLGGHRLSVRFDDGRSRELDLAKRLKFTGVFKPLLDPSVFARVRVNPDIGTICWPNDADVNPVVLYSRVTGEPVESVLSKRGPRTASQAANTMRRKPSPKARTKRPARAP